MNPNELMVSLERQLKPYRGEFPSLPRLPQEGLARTEVAGLVERLAVVEESRWRQSRRCPGSNSSPVGGAEQDPEMWWAQAYTRLNREQ